MDREKQRKGEARRGGSLEWTPDMRKAAALEMLDTFASVGVRQFDITHTNIDQERRGFRRGQTLEQTRRSLPFLVESALRRQNNVIIRPHESAQAALIQLDDLTPEDLGRVRQAAFLVLETSPDNYQAWVAVSGRGPDLIGLDKDFARRLRKGTGADPTASGATRVAGTHNYKPKYADNFPVVAVVEKHPGRIVTPTLMALYGILAAPGESRHSPARALSPACLPTGKKGKAGGWPSYRMCLSNAPEARGGGRADVSRADFTFALIAIDWGRSPDEVAGRLMEESQKARTDGRRYAQLTARNAAHAVAARSRNRP